MSNIKIIYYDSDNISVVSFEKLLTNTIESLYKIQPGLCLVNYQGSAKELYDIIQEFASGYNLLVMDISIDNNGYWGYMNRNLWEWLKNNINLPNRE